MLVKSKQLALVRTILVAGICLGHVLAQGRPTITFDNRSGDDALVHLSGPTSGFVEVRNLMSSTVAVKGGSYTIYVRYGRVGTFRYAKGDSFIVYESPYGVDRVSITLHKVVGRNYHTSQSDEAEFNRAR